MARLHLILLETDGLSSKVEVAFCISFSNAWKSLFCIIISNNNYNFFKLAFLNKYVVLSYCCFNLRFPSDRLFWPSFHMIIVIGISLLIKYLFILFCLLFFFLFNLIVLCIFWTDTFIKYLPLKYIPPLCFLTIHFYNSIFNRWEVLILKNCKLSFIFYFLVNGFSFTH